MRPEECVVVGDTTSDMGMGRNGNAGLVVGVLSGSGKRKQLVESGAHLILPDIGMLRGSLRSGSSPKDFLKMPILVKSN